MNVKIEVAALTIGLATVTPIVRVVSISTEVLIPAQRVASSFSRILDFSNTSLSAVAPDLSQNGGRYALV